MADEPQHWQVDDVIGGKYRLVRVLGEGGMGIVFEACHLRLKQRLAIKMVRSTLATQNNVVLRFEREARAAAQLRSAHVAKVFDVDATPDGVPYIVMEFLEGSDLANILATRKRLEIREAVGLVLETCCAIAEAHDLGIVHRDLKPSNLFLAFESGRSIIKVLDFGISKLMDESDASLTSSQVTLGTPNYMSPEQVRSARFVDARTDVWSLGVILYELLSGKVPFRGESSASVIAAIIADRVPNMREDRPDVPPALEAAVLRALAKNVEDRFADVRALAQALVPFADASGYLGAELAHMLASGARTLPSARSDSFRKEGAPTAPTAPGWSGISPTGVRPPKWTLFLVTLAALVAVGWFARSMLKRPSGPDPVISSAASATIPPAVVGAVGSAIEPTAPPIHADASIEEASNVALPDASPAAAVQAAPRKMPPKPRPLPRDKPANPPASPSNNPLHL
jgi:serine/threonine-protein kinase